MHRDPSTPPIPAVSRDAQIDHLIMGMLLIDYQGLWSVEEVARAMNNRVDAADGLNRLHGAGMIHRVGDFVFATRTAAHAETLTA